MVLTCTCCNRNKMTWNNYSLTLRPTTNELYYINTIRTAKDQAYRGFIVYVANSKKMITQFKMMPWEQHFGMGWNSLNSFLLPMYIILICAMIPQIEYKNNAWKQVFSSPQSTANIFFSKFLTVHLMIL